MKDSVSLIICCDTSNMQKKMIWKTKVTFKVFVFSEFAAYFTKKKMTFYDSICLQQMIYKYKA